MNQSQSRAMRPCDDIIGLIGEAVKNKREEVARTYWVGLSRQNTFLPPSFLPPDYNLTRDPRLCKCGHGDRITPFSGCELEMLLREGIRTWHWSCTRHWWKRRRSWGAHHGGVGVLDDTASPTLTLCTTADCD